VRNDCILRIARYGERGELGRLGDLAADPTKQLVSNPEPDSKNLRRLAYYSSACLARSYTLKRFSCLGWIGMLNPAGTLLARLDGLGELGNGLTSTRPIVISCLPFGVTATSTTRDGVCGNTNVTFPPKSWEPEQSPKESASALS